MKGMSAALKSGLKIIGGIMNHIVLEFECVGMDNGGKFPIEYTGRGQDISPESFSRMRSSTPFTRISISWYSTESLSMAKSLLSLVVHINSESAGYQLIFHVGGQFLYKQHLVIKL